eukprot:Pgem_evm1s1881
MGYNYNSPKNSEEVGTPKFSISRRSSITSSPTSDVGSKSITGNAFLASSPTTSTFSEKLKLKLYPADNRFSDHLTRKHNFQPHI